MIWGWQMYKCMPCTQYACLLSLFWRLLVLRSVVQVAVFCLVSVTMVSTSVLIWTVNSKSVLQFLFLLSQFHRVHKVIDASQGPHWRWEPGLYISILTHHQHAEVVTVDLQLISETLYHILWKRLLLRLTFPCRKIFHRSFLMLQLYVFLEMRKEEEIMFKILPFNGKNSTVPEAVDPVPTIFNKAKWRIPVHIDSI